jgi:hypothetical protein
MLESGSLGSAVVSTAAFSVPPNALEARIKSG